MTQHISELFLACITSSLVENDIMASCPRCHCVAMTLLFSRPLSS